MKMPVKASDALPWAVACMTSPRELVIRCNHGGTDCFDVPGKDVDDDPSTFRVIEVREKGRFAVICKHQHNAGDPMGMSSGDGESTCIFMTRDQLHAAMFAIAMVLSNGDDA